MIKTLIFTVFLSLISNYSYAYLDPGSGGSIIQIIMAMIAAVGAFLSFYWTKFKLFFIKLFKKDKNNKIT